MPAPPSHDLSHELWPPEPFSALIFDCDGTLADNDERHLAALRAAIAPHGLDVDAGWHDARRGWPARSLVAELARDGGLGLDEDDVLARRLEHYVTATTPIRPLADVVAVARAFAGTVPIAVASSGQARAVWTTLRTLELDDVFDAVVTLEDVGRPKPAPDAYLFAADRLKVDPAHCVAYEDSSTGADAARAAGMRVVMVGKGSSCHDHAFELTYED